MRSSLLGSINAGAAAGVNPAAQAFLDATGITDETITTAIDTLVNSLEADGIWDKCDAIYPFVGGTADTHKYNLKDPQDTNGAFRITWAGTVTHDANGITGNGTTGYGDTHLIPSTDWTGLDTHISAYCRTASADTGFLIGCSNLGAALRVYLRLDDGGGNALSTQYTDSGYNGAGTIGVANGGTSAMFTASRRAAGDFELYRNAASIKSQSTGSAAASMPDVAIAVCASNANGTPDSFSNRNLAFITLGSGLSDTEVSNLYTAVQAFQTTLGRQV